MQLNLPAHIREVAGRLLQHQHQVYLVGGSIRALLLGEPPKDYDLTTDATPAELLAIFSAYKTIKIGQAFGTILVIVEDKPVEITTMRLESSYQQHRYPTKVVFTSSILSDLARRDFTINAMAWPLGPALGKKELIDPHGGQRDLSLRLVRAVGQAALRLEEDALRILRALRFAASLGFSLETNTARAVHDKACLLAGLARERILAELKQIFVAPGLALILADFLPVFTAAVPELLPLCANGATSQKARQAAVTAVSLLPECFMLRLTALLLAAAELEKKDPVDYTVRAFTRLSSDRATISTSKAVLKARENLPPADKISVKMWLKDFPPDIARAALLLEKARVQAQAADQKNLAGIAEQVRLVMEAKACYRLADLAINGQDIIGLGMKAGPGLGRLLDQLLDLVIREQLPNEKDRLLLKAADLLAQKTDPF